MAADLESEENCCRSEERVCGSQWPSAPISIVTSSDIIPFVSRSLKACWYISLLSFLDLALWRQVSYTEQFDKDDFVSTDYDNVRAG